MPRGAILFDLDGTLTDPVEGITRCIAYALERMNAPVPPRSELARCVGPPLRVSFPLLLGPDCDAAQVEEAVQHYRDRFTTVGLYENVLYAGITAMLERLYATATPLYVATAKPHPMARRVLEHFGLAPYFAGVYGAELDGTFDDKGDLLAHLLTQENLAPERALMIGDRSHDVVAARRNGIRAVGVTYGYGTAEELLSAGAEALCATPDEIAALGMEWMSALR